VELLEKINYKMQSFVNVIFRVISYEDDAQNGIVSEGFFSSFFSTFQTHFVQLIKLSEVFIRPIGIQALPSPVIPS